MPAVVTVLLWVFGSILALLLILLVTVSFLMYFVVYSREIPAYGQVLLGDNMTSDMSDPAEVNRVQWAKDTEAFIEETGYEEMHTKSFDGLNLYGKLILGDPDSKRVVIAVHGYHSSAALDFGGVIQFYHDLGYNVFLPDNRAHGKSEGKLLGFGWLDRLDLVVWAKKMARRFGPDSEIILSGVSMGGAAVMMASGEDLPEQVKAIIEDCGFSSAMDQFGYMFPSQVKFLAPVVLFFCNLISVMFNNHSLYKASSVKQIEKNTRPMLFIHGAKDTFVPTEMIYRNYEACTTKKQMLIVPNAHHAQACDADFDLYKEAVKKFLTDTIGL